MRIRRVYFAITPTIRARTLGQHVPQNSGVDNKFRSQSKSFICIELRKRKAAFSLETIRRSTDSDAVKFSMRKLHKTDDSKISDEIDEHTRLVPELKVGGFSAIAETTGTEEAESDGKGIAGMEGRETAAGTAEREGIT